jgi:hypothetical protein
MNQLVNRNEFGNELAAADTAATAVAAKAKALVEARYIMALRNPRDMDVVRERLLKECSRPAFAAVARYEKPIGKDRSKWPKGPSIRFAEAAVRCMGNITVETITSYDDREKRILNVVVTDLESNVPYGQDITIAKTIERRNKKEGDTVISTRTNSYGDLVYILEATDDDIVNKQQALISKAIRTQGLRLIPGDIVDECMDQVMVTQANTDAQDPNAAKRKLFDAFGAVGVRAEQLKEYLGHDAESVSPKELADLRALYTAIRDGEATWRDVMDTKAAAAQATATGIDAVRAAATGKPAAATETEKKEKPASKTPAAKTEPAATSGKPPSRSYAAYAEAIQKASGRDTAALELDAARSDLPSEQYEQLCDFYRSSWPD